MSTAEVASTFFEQAVLSEMEDQFTDEEKIILLHNRILGDITTIHRQIACFNFELELHQRIRNEGQLSKEDMAKLMKKHLQSYLGEAFDITDDDGFFFVTWSHIRRFFYVYSYAFGQIVIRSLFENWKKDPAYETKIREFLSLGGSMSPEDIFKKVGIDTSDPKFFESGLKSIEKDIDRLEKLVSKKK
jgi:oligoendopeptidase F